MFKQLTQRLESTWSTIRGKQLTEKNVQDTLQSLRSALVDADVALPVVETFIEKIRTEALGTAVIQSLTPGHTLMKIVQDSLVTLLGGAEQTALTWSTQPPTVILVAGLQGSGKTTTVAKLAHHLKNQQQKSVMVASVDIYRPGAIEQLRSVVEGTDIHCFTHEKNNGLSAVELAKAALVQAQQTYTQVLIIDTAGRLHVDQNMMDEIREIHRVVQPQETLFVIDSMTGQDAAHTAEAFHQALPLTGVILTKVDGDARGGAALSVTQLTGKPIKFIGTGEKITALEPFYPDRMAARLLGEGDLLSLAEEASRAVKPEQAQKMAKQLRSGSFDLNDLRQQIDQLSAMGGLEQVLTKLPNMGAMGEHLQAQGGASQLKQMKAMIDSMTPDERSHVELLLPPKDRKIPQVLREAKSRLQRIAKGSGVTPQEVKRLAKQAQQMQKVLKQMKSVGFMGQLAGKLGSLGGLGGRAGMPLDPNAMGSLEDLFKK